MLKKKEFLAAVAEKAETTAKVVDAVITGVENVVVEEIKKGEKVQLGSLCTFIPKHVPGGERKRRNPQTGEVKIVNEPDKNTVKIKVSKSFAELIK